jgi:hypothetical protein
MRLALGKVSTTSLGQAAAGGGPEKPEDGGGATK